MRINLQAEGVRKFDARSTPSVGEQRCRVCNASDLKLEKPSNVPPTVSARDFTISDDRYGTTWAIYRCAVCGFLQCPELTDVTPYYREMEDPAYELSRPARRLQARALLDRIARTNATMSRPPRLLDIGAGSGVLVEEAVKRGMLGTGVEPSVWLQNKAVERGLNVVCGTLPHPKISGDHDIATLIDVLEHVTEPRALLSTATAHVRPGGLVVIVTPDVASLAARIIGRKWWHFRLAHVGYFSTATLSRLCAESGLVVIARSRPGWYFPLSYLYQRAMRYVPRWARHRPPRWAEKIIVPLNLFDSIMLIAQRPVAEDRDLFQDIA